MPGFIVDLIGACLTCVTFELLQKLRISYPLIHTGEIPKNTMSAETDVHSEVLNV